jgi:hypothetical protein
MPRLRIAAIVLLCFVAAACGGASAQQVPTGTFRTTVSDSALAAAGVSDIPENHGTYTLTLLPKGRWKLHQVAPNVLQAPDHSGTYVVTKNAVRFEDPVFAVGFTARVSLQGGRLRFTVLRADLPELRVVFGGRPWREMAIPQ